MEICGFAKLTVWLTMDVPDTDLGMELWEVLPDGSAVQLSPPPCARVIENRCGRRSWLSAGKPEKYLVRQFHIFLAPNCQRQPAAPDCSQHQLRPAQKRTTTAVESSPEETGKDARTAHIQLLHDAEHASVLELPVVKRGML